MVKVSKYVETKVISPSNSAEAKMETKVLWNNVGDYIRRLCNNINKHLTNKYVFEIISGRVFLPNYGKLIKINFRNNRDIILIKKIFSNQIEIRSKDVSILFRVVRSDYEKDARFEMVMSDRNIFPEPFESLSKLKNSCQQYGYYEYGNLVRCIGSEEFIRMLQQGPALQIEQ